MPKSNLYTGGGDAGMTSLVGGERTSKCCVRLEAYGTVDEFSSFLGVILSHPQCPPEIKLNLLDIQNMLFNLGGYLACRVEDNDTPQAWGLTCDHIAKLEKEIDRLDNETPKIRAFVLPGGTPLSAHTHVARTVCRRAERRIIALTEQAYVDPNLIKYFNRLSDYLFILARYFNHIAGVEEITWQK